MTDLLTHALACHDAGLAVVPIAPDGQKRPSVTWTAYQDTQPTRDQVHTWFTTKDTDGLGVITGAGSGNLEMLEVEARGLLLLTDLAALLADNGLTDLWNRLNKGWVEASPSGGIHWHYRVDGPAARNTRLARRPATPQELEANPADKIKVLIETRGQGGFTVIAPSSGRTHPTGKAWTTIAGGPDTIPTLTVEERDALYIIAGALDDIPTPDPTPATTTKPTDGSLRPGDDYNARATWDDILTPHGWTKVKRIGPGYGWTRPGKEARDGISATTGTAKDGVDRLYVFSTSTEFEAEKPYSKFSAYTLLQHNGDHSAAARALRAEGYGTTTPLTPSEDTWPTPAPPETATTPGGNGPPPPSTPAPSTISSSDASAAASNSASPSRHLSVVDGTSARIIETSDAGRIAEHYGPTEDGTARALARLHATGLRYCPQRGSWLTWTGSRWEWDQRETHREHIRDIARALPEDDGWKTYKKRALSATGVSGIARLAQSDPTFVVHIDDLDANPYELNTPGGIIDLRTGQLRPPDPAALHTRTTAAAPDFDRPGQAWEAFLLATFGDPDLIAYMQRLTGLSAIGTVLEQIFLFAHGAGANGKSTFAEAGMHALGRGEGGYAISAPSEMLMVRRHSEHPAELAQLAGARMVICSELEDGARFAEARIKQLTGRDSINARFMRRDPFTFTPSHTMWLLGNHKPDATVGGTAFWRRVQLIPFDNVVPAEKRDPHLSEKLEEEAPAILAWIARGAADYHNNGGLRIPAAVQEATSGYQHDQDTVGRFVDERCERIGSVSVTKLRDAYEKWCDEEGSAPVSARRLTQELRDRFGVEQSRTARERRYEGISVPVIEADNHDGDRGGW